MRFACELGIVRGIGEDEDGRCWERAAAAIATACTTLEAAGIRDGMYVIAYGMELVLRDKARHVRRIAMVESRRALQRGRAETHVTHEASSADAADTGEAESLNGGDPGGECGVLSVGSVASATPGPPPQPTREGPVAAAMPGALSVWA